MITVKLKADTSSPTCIANIQIAPNSDKRDTIAYMNAINTEIGTGDRNRLSKLKW